MKICYVGRTNCKIKTDNMNYFTCSVCGEQHVLETLIEFPQPHIVGEITGGDLPISMSHIGKNSVCINREYFLMESELKIKITDYEDELDLMVWVKIKISETRNQFKRSTSNDKIFLKGKLMHFIPYYDGTENMPIEIELDFSRNGMTSSIYKINKDIKLKADFENGITLNELKEMLQKYYHEEDLAFSRT